MSTFIPKHLTPFQDALTRLGPTGADELRQALYKGAVRACLMDDGEIALPPDWWASDRTWNKAVAEGRGSLSTGPTYYEHVRRGRILVWSDDLDRLLASRQHRENGVAPGAGAAARGCSTPASIGRSPYGSAVDPSEAAYWTALQALIWASTRKMKWVRLAVDLSQDPTQVIFQAILDGTVMSYEAAEEDAIERLSTGELRALGLRDGTAKAEEIEQSQWPYLQFTLPPPYSSDARGLCARPHDYNSRSQADCPYWTKILLAREAVLKAWPPQLIESDTCYPLIGKTKADVLGRPENRAVQTSKKCRQWLERFMSTGKPPKLAKRLYRKRAQKKFNVSCRAFDREWATAIEDTGAAAWGWGKAGAKPRQKSTH